MFALPSPWTRFALFAPISWGIPRFRGSQPTRDRLESAPCRRRFKARSAEASALNKFRHPRFPHTCENRAVERCGLAALEGAETPARRALRATQRHSVPDRRTCLGDKRSPVQIRAPR
jgi:hypothetical protein